MNALTKYDKIDCDETAPEGGVGWYPGCVSWDGDEGGFANALYWDGKEWDRDGGPPVYYIPQRFDDEAAAQALAEKLDLGW